MTEVQGQMSDLIAPHRPPRGGADPLQRPARASSSRSLRDRDAAAAAALIRTHIRGTEHILAGLI